jgi:hypothetical protein
MRQTLDWVSDSTIASKSNRGKCRFALVGVFDISTAHLLVSNDLGVAYFPTPYGAFGVKPLAIILA